MKFDLKLNRVHARVVWNVGHFCSGFYGGNKPLLKYAGLLSTEALRTNVIDILMELKFLKKKVHILSAKCRPFLSSVHVLNDQNRVLCLHGGYLFGATHAVKKLSVLLALCEGIPRVAGDFETPWHSCDVIADVALASLRLQSEHHDWKKINKTVPWWHWVIFRKYSISKWFNNWS